jgi:DNA anti-recombination protein RmuC
VSSNSVTPNAGALGALQAVAGSSAQGLDLVREVLFGAEKRQTSEEFNQLKTQLAQHSDRMAKQMAAMEQSFNDKISTLTTQTQARITALEATVTGNRTSAGDALNQLRAAQQTQHEAFVKTLSEERRAADARQAAFVAHMRDALDVFSGNKKA